MSQEISSCLVNHALYKFISLASAESRRESHALHSSLSGGNPSTSTPASPKVTFAPDTKNGEDDDDDDDDDHDQDEFGFKRFNS